MPNHCYQGVYLAGNPKEIDRLYEAVKEEKFLSAVVPEPSTMFHGALGEEERKMCEAEDRPNWYDWHNENWNTKWDICDVEIEEEITREDYTEFSFDAYTKHWFKFKCWTAWAPPVPVWQKLHNMGIEVLASYQDEGGIFEGTFIEGKNKSWKPWLREVVSNG